MATRDGCGRRRCSASTGLSGSATFGAGVLDENGYWEFPCLECEEAWKKHVREERVRRKEISSGIWENYTRREEEMAAVRRKQEEKGMTIKEVYDKFDKLQSLTTAQGMIEGIYESNSSPNSVPGFVRVEVYQDGGNTSSFLIDSTIMLRGLINDCIDKNTNRIEYTVDMRGILYTYRAVQGGR